MKTFCFLIMIVVFLLLNTNRIQAQTTPSKLSPVCLDNTEQFSITSKYVAGENYVIQVGLPIGYSSANKPYPVLYVLDGDKSFGMTKEITGLLMMGNEIKDIIVVGISYGQAIDVWNEKRTRDLTTGGDTLLANGWHAGGSDNFIKFIQYELFPVVNKNYRTNPDSSAICGTSYGGLLNSYILFKQPELFRNYIISSPSLNWRKKITLKFETEYFSNHKELNATVYLTYGSLESKIFTNTIDEFISNIQMHNYKGLRLVTRIFEGETHYSVPSTAFTNGLKTIFKS